MLRDRYEPQDLFALVPKLQLALDPELAQLDALLDDDDLFARVRADLHARAPFHPGRSDPPLARRQAPVHLEL